MKKKLITGILATLACLTCFAGVACKNDDPATSEITIDLEGAKAYADDLFRAENTSVRADYTLLNSIIYGDITYTLTWSVVLPDGVTSGVTITRGENETKVDVDEALAEDLKYTLVLTISAPNSEDTVKIEFARTVEKAPTKVPAKITQAPVEGTAYKLHIYHAQAQTDYYMTGNIYKTYEYYFEISNSYDKAIDVFVEAVADKEGKFYIYHNGPDGNAKKYINAYKTSDNKHISNYFEDTAKTEWFFDAEIGTMVTVINDLDGNDSKFYLGCDTDPSHKSISPQTGSANNMGCLIEMVDRTTVSNEDKVAQTKKELTVAPVHVGAGSVDLTAVGATFPETTITWAIKSGEGATLADNKLSVATAPTAATSYTLTATITAGDKSDTKDVVVKFIPNETKAILDAAFALEKSTDFANEVELTGIVSGFMKNGEYNSEYGNVSVNLMVAYEGDEYKKIGCYRMQSSGTGVNLATLGVGDTIKVKGIFTNYNDSIQLDQDCVMLELVNDGTDADVPGYEAPAANPELSTEAYKFYLTAKDATDYYLSGEMDGTNRLATTNVAANAKDVFAEKSGSSYKFYIMDGETKKYINARLNGSSKVVEFATESSCVYDYDATTKCWYTTIDSTQYYLGTYSTYTTISLSEKSFISASNTGVSQFPATLKLASELAPDNTATDEEKVSATVAEIAKLGTVYVGNTTVDLPTAGVAYNDVAINWAVEGAGASYADGTLTFAPTATGTITVTATVSKGEVNDSSKVFTIKLVNNTPADIVNAAFALSSGEAFANEVTLTGVVSKAYYNSNKNYYAPEIDLEGKTIQCYKITGTGVDAVALGDILTVKGIIKNYNGTIEFDAPTLESVETPLATEKTIAQAIETGATLNRLKITGTIINVKNETNKEMTIADANGDYIYIYKAKTSETISVGQSITVEGTLSVYNGAVQINQPKVTALTAGELVDIHKVAQIAMGISVDNNITEAGSKTLPITNADYAGSTIAWASDKAFAVVENDTITYTLQDEEATVTLTATITVGTASNEYTFVVALAAKPSDGTLVANLTTSDLELANATAFTSHNIDDNITISGVKGSNSNDPKYYTTGTAIRLYAGNVFTISCAENYKISSIVLTVDASKSITDSSWVTNANSVTGLSTTEITIMPTDGTADITITMPGTSGHWRLVAISVTYVEIAE